MAKQQPQATNKGKSNQQQGRTGGGSAGSRGGSGRPSGDQLDPVIAKRLKAMNEKWEQSREESTKPGFTDGTTLSDARHICRLSAARLILAKGKPAVVFEFTCVQGDEIGEKGVRFSNFDTDDGIVYLQRDLRKLGAPVDEFDAEQLPAQLKQLLEEAPAVRITVRTNDGYKNVYIDKMVNLEDEGIDAGDAGTTEGGDEPGDDATDDSGDDTGDDTGEDAGDDSGDDSGDDAGTDDTSTEDDDDGELPPDKGDKVAVIHAGKKVKGTVVSFDTKKKVAMVSIPKVPKPVPFKQDQLTILAA